MKARALQALDRRLETYLFEMTAPLGRAERRRAAGQYLRGLLLDGERKSVEPLAARVGGDVQSLQQFIGQSPWPALPLHTALNASMSALLGRGRYWVIDETPSPSQAPGRSGWRGKYCGALGQDRQLPDRGEPALERGEPLLALGLAALPAGVLGGRPRLAGQSGRARDGEENTPDETPPIF